MNKEDFNAYTREFDDLTSSLELLKSGIRFGAHKDILQSAIETAVQKHRLESQGQVKQGDQLSLIQKGQ